jgi:hypothetical protein
MPVIGHTSLQRGHHRRPRPPEADIQESYYGVIGPMVPSTVDETRCAVWAVLTETANGPGSPPPAELLQKRLPPGLILEGFWQTDYLTIGWRKMPG